MFSVFFVFNFLTALPGLKALVEIPKVEVDDLVITEEIIKNTTNGILSSLKFVKPVNNTKIKEFSILHHYFLSVTFQNSDNLKEIVRRTRVDHKKTNQFTRNLTTVLNELLDEDQCDLQANDAASEDDDTYVLQYVNDFLAKLEALKENYGVNKVFSDINSNIIKFLQDANLRGRDLKNLTYTNVDNYTLLDSNEFWGSIFPSLTFPDLIPHALYRLRKEFNQGAWNNRFFRENPAFLSVRVGSSFYANGGENIPVLEIYFHPGYDPKTLWNNICVLRLVRHIKFLKRNRKSVKKILIDNKPWNLPTNTPGITIVGWGAKGPRNTLSDPFVNILSFAVLDVYPLRECQEVYSKGQNSLHSYLFYLKEVEDFKITDKLVLYDVHFYREYVTKKNFCGGFFSKGAGACNRDVGAPGVVDGILMGVVSFGSPVCGTPDAPTVFTKVGYYSSWIRQIMKLKVPRRKKKATTKITIDPFARITTTKITTTTFKIEPLKSGQGPPSVTDGEDEPLRTIDDKMFQEFLETMFGSNEVEKYQNLLNRDKGDLREQKNNNDQEKQNISLIEEHTTVAYDDIRIPVTVGYESEDALRTEFDPIDYDVVTEAYPVTKYSTDVEESYQKTHFIPLQKYTTSIERHMNETRYYITKIDYTSTSITTETPQEIFLELATESGSDSIQSEQVESDIKLAATNKSLEDSSSGDMSDVPGEQVIADLLDEIDLNEILREVATDPTISSESSIQSYQENWHSNRFVISPTTAHTPNSASNGVRETKKIERKEREDKDSVLTLLYLSDDERKKQANPNNVVRVHNSEAIFNKNARPKEPAAEDCPACNKIYNLVPKSELFEILTRVIQAALGNTRERND